MTDRHQVTMWGLSDEQRDALLALSRAWDSFYAERPYGPGTRQEDAAEAAWLECRSRLRVDANSPRTQTLLRDFFILGYKASDGWPGLAPVDPTPESYSIGGERRS